MQGISSPGLAQAGGQLLFHLISRLYERTSIIVTHHCDIVETGNASWRFKHRAQS